MLAAANKIPSKMNSPDSCDPCSKNPSNLVSTPDFEVFRSMPFGSFVRTKSPRASPALLAGFMMLSASFSPVNSGSLGAVEGASGAGVRGTSSCAFFAIAPLNSVETASSFGATGASRACVEVVSCTGLAPGALSVDEDGSCMGAKEVSRLECVSPPKRHVSPAIEIVAAASKNQESFAFGIFFLSGASAFVDAAAINSRSPDGCGGE